MSELTKHRIEMVRDTLTHFFTPRDADKDIHAVCDYALRTLDAEQRADHHARAYDELFDEAIEVRKQRDQARQEAAKLREALQDIAHGWMSEDARIKTASLALDDWPMHSSDAPASEPEKCPKCNGTGDMPTVAPGHTRPCNACGATGRVADPAPADRPESTKGGCMCQRCGRRFTMDFVVPPETWERIKPEDAAIGGGLLCGRCITDSLEAIGEATIYRIYNPDVGDSYHTDRPEPSEALEALADLVDAAGSDDDIGRDEGIDKDDAITRRHEIIRRALSQPAPAVPDAVRQPIEELHELLSGSWSKDQLIEVVNRARRACGQRTHADSARPAVPNGVHDLPQLFRGRGNCNQQRSDSESRKEVYYECALELERALAQPSESPAVPDDRDQAVELVARIIERHTEKPPGPPDPPYDYQPEWIKRLYRRKAEAALDRIEIAAAPTPDEGEK